ncbi:choice-of-anchor D domain-containing protein [Myxococcota bacterium]|nr:choice-of-anchor D domain-containing protein [Myxococcota bacterium]
MSPPLKSGLARPLCARAFVAWALLAVPVLGCSDNELAAVPPDIQVDPTEVVIGTVTLGVVEEEALNLRNVGRGTLHVESVTLKYPERIAFSVEDFAGDLVPDETSQVRLTFDALELGEAENVVVVASDDPDEPIVEVPIRVAAVVPEPVPAIQVEPLSLAWGAVPTGAAQPRTVLIRSVGTADLDLSSVSLSPGTSFDFSLSGDPAPVLLEPGAETVAEVVYAPTDDTDDVGSLLVESDDPDSPLVEVPLSGSRTVTPDIEVDPTLLDFGVLALGAAATRSAEIRNAGGADLTLGSLSLSGATAPGFAITADPGGSVLAPGESAQVEVTLVLAQTGASTGQVVIPSDDPDEDPVYIDLVALYDAVPEIDVSPTVVDFGTLEVGTTASQVVEVRNIGAATLDVGSLSLSGSADFSFSALAFPGAVPPGGVVDVTVSYFVSDEVADSGILSIPSNDADEPVVEVALFGEATLHPDIEVVPTTLAFGSVPVGSASSLTATISNVGSADLDLTSLTLSGSSAFGLTLNPAPRTLLPGESVLMQVTYTPPAGTSHTGVVAVASDDPDEPIVNVSLNGTGEVIVLEEPPVADAGPDRTEVPLDTITLDGTGSYDPDGDIPLTYAWTLVSRPAGSTTALGASTSAHPTLYLDLAGTYVVGLVVTDTTGLSSTQDQAVITVTPWQDFHVQLTWDTDGVDLDLHLLQAGTALYDRPNDCCWCNETPSWHGASTGDDPTLDIDDLNGFGPENINIVSPANGDYAIEVVYYGEFWSGASHATCSGACASTTATLRLYLNGILVHSDTRLMNSAGQVWYVGDVDWPTGVVSAVDTVSTTTRTGCY